MPCSWPGNRPSNVSGAVSLQRKQVETWSEVMVASILLIDDDTSLLDGLALAFEDEGFDAG